MYCQAETFDKLQFMYEETGFNDHQLHCLIEFSGHIDEEILRKALAGCIETIPILGMTYYHRNGNGYWAIAGRKEEAFVRVYTKETFDAFTLSKIEIDSKPQVRLCLFRDANDHLSLIMNHMVCDASDFKKFLYLLSETYNHLYKDPEYKGYDEWKDTRNTKKVLSQVGYLDKIKSLLLQRKESNQESRIRLPFHLDSQVRPIIETIDLEQTEFEEVKGYAKRHKVTINDIVMGVYSKVILEILGLDEIQFAMPIMIDMRQYSLEADKNNKCLANLSSTVIVKYQANKDENSQELIRKIHKVMVEKKSHKMGVNGLVKLALIETLLPKGKAYSFIKKNLSNPEIFMTNIGIIDNKRLDFQDTSIKKAYMTGSIKYRPHFQIAVSSFDGELTLSSNLYGDEDDRLMMKKILAMIKKELLLLKN